ncbi:uncharacterized protein LOC143626547 [Bidens hawaiensis]|uniref:uncharacterized protein LOC143626547 n=1 Tax=Bidens hawaiensis TaxID=980011 RepID=UPI004049A22A
MSMTYYCFGNDIPTLEGVKAWLGNCFSIKDLVEAAYILGIRIYRDRSRRLIGLNQSAYIDKILKRFKMENSKKGLVPIQRGTMLSASQCPSSKDEQDKMSGIPFASAIGSIMYAMICTRPDVSCALSMTSRYQQNPGTSHWMAVKSILKYLRRTKDMLLIYGSGEEELVVKGYTDASFQTDRDDSRSQSGYVFVLNGGAVSWKSAKQDVVVLSTIESEYIAASLAAQEAAWIRKFITDLGVVRTIQDPLEIFCDNEGAIAQIKEPCAHQKTRHIERRFNYIGDEAEKGKISLHACHMEETQSVSSYVLKMKSHIDRLERLNCPVSKELATDLILNGLTKRFETFVINYNMNGWDKSIGELHAMLKTAEAGMGKKVLPVLAINEGGSKKRHHQEPKARVAVGNGQVKKGFKGKAKAEPKPKKLKVSAEDPCFGCVEIGHWMRNCPTYLKELKAKRDAGQTSGTTFMVHIDLNIISSNTWVLDNDCGTHICNSLQGFKIRNEVKKGDISLFMGNGAKVDVQARGDYVLKLPNGLEIILKNILYSPSLTRNIISVSLLRQSGYDFKFVDNGIYFFMDNVFYFKAMPFNGIYELIHDDSYIDNSLYQANTKRLKIDLSNTFLWHCRLGHIN